MDGQFHKASVSPKEKEIKGGIGPENTIYDIAPELKLYKKNADVSYTWRGNLNKREADIYRDQNGDAWFEITKSPRKQMMISLLSQQFFNVANVIEVPQKEIGNVSKFFSKINPKFAKLYDSLTHRFRKSTPAFLSKEMDLTKVEQKSHEEMLADFLVFESIFDSEGHGDRNFMEGHNVKRFMNGYAFFDFDQAGILPLKHFAEYKETQDKINNGTYGYFPQLKNMITKDGYYQFGRRVPHILDGMLAVAKKLKEIEAFFKGKEGEDFVRAVLRKTKYAEEYKEQNEKKSDSGSLDESYADPHELTQGMLAQVNYKLNGLLAELEEHKAEAVEQQEDKEGALKNYEKIVSQVKEMAAHSS